MPAYADFVNHTGWQLNSYREPASSSYLARDPIRCCCFTLPASGFSYPQADPALTVPAYAELGSDLDPHRDTTRAPRPIIHCVGRAHRRGHSGRPLHLHRDRYGTGSMIVRWPCGLPWLHAPATHFARQGARLLPASGKSWCLCAYRERPKGEQRPGKHSS